MRRRNNEMLRGKNGKRERESTVELSTCVLSLHPLIVRGQPRGDLEETATSPQNFPQMALAAVHGGVFSLSRKSRVFQGGSMGAGVMIWAHEKDITRARGCA